MPRSCRRCLMRGSTLPAADPSGDCLAIKKGESFAESKCERAFTVTFARRCRPKCQPFVTRKRALPRREKAPAVNAVGQHHRLHEVVDRGHRATARRGDADAMRDRFLLFEKREPYPNVRARKTKTQTPALSGQRATRYDSWTRDAHTENPAAFHISRNPLTRFCLAPC